MQPKKILPNKSRLPHEVLRGSLIPFATLIGSGSVVVIDNRTVFEENPNRKPESRVDFKKCVAAKIPPDAGDTYVISIGDSKMHHDMKNQWASAGTLHVTIDDYTELECFFAVDAAMVKARMLKRTYVFVTEKDLVVKISKILDVMPRDYPPMVFIWAWKKNAAEMAKHGNVIELDEVCKDWTFTHVPRKPQ